MNREQPSGSGGGGTPNGDEPDSAPLIDLPLGRDEAGQPVPSPAPTAGPDRHARRRRGRRSEDPPQAAYRRRSKLPWLLAGLVVVAAALAAGWWLRPDPPLLRAGSSLLEFGPQRLGGAADPIELTLVNDGGRGRAVGGTAVTGAAAGDFAVVEDGCSGRRLAAGEECALAVGFEPAEEGDRRAVLEISGDAANAPMAVPLAGEGTVPRLAVSPTEVAFAPREIGEAAPAAAVTVENRGTAPLTVRSIEVEGSAASDFRTGGRCAGRRLEPGESCPLTVVFTPRAAGERRASARVISDAPGRAPLVSLAGTGAERTAELVFEPEAVDFGSMAVGGPPRERRVTVTNRGDAPARVTAVRVASADRGFELREDGCSGSTLPPGGSCRLTVAFAAASAEAVETPLRIELEGGGAGPWVRLAGAGEGVRLGAEPDRLDFGRVRTGEEAERTVALANRGGVAITLRRPAIDGPDAGDFRLVGGCREGALLSPGESCALTVRFVPEGSGERLARLVVEPAEAGGRLEVPLAGDAAAPAAPRARLEPPAVDFGEQRVGERSGIRDLTLSNVGDARLPIAGARVEGDAAGDFRIVPGSCAGLDFLVPGGDCSIGVRFTPSAPGARRAELVVRHGAGGGRSAVRLTGSGVAP